VRSVDGIPARSAPAPLDPLLAALQLALEYHGIRRSPEALLSGLPPTRALTSEMFVRAARMAGCHADQSERSLERIPDLVLPVVIELRDGSASLLISREADGCRCPSCYRRPVHPAASWWDSLFCGRAHG